LGLPDPALVEKDWFVIRALAAITAADHGPFQLVFQGGTALSRAHRVIERMSEDIDIEISSEGPPPGLALRRLRESITGELLKAGFNFDPANPEHRNRTTKAATRCIACHMSRSRRGRGLCGRKSRSKPPSGLRAGRRSNGPWFHS
jgi:hypothetical protein